VCTYLNSEQVLVESCGFNGLLHICIPWDPWTWEQILRIVLYTWYKSKGKTVYLTALDLVPCECFDQQAEPTCVHTEIKYGNVT
jgi:hypothetical protein